MLKRGRTARDECPIGIDMPMKMTAKRRLASAIRRDFVSAAFAFAITKSPSKR
jgi:hypothetical protein